DLLQGRGTAVTSFANVSDGAREQINFCWEKGLFRRRWTTSAPGISRIWRRGSQRPARAGGLTPGQVIAPRAPRPSPAELPLVCLVMRSVLDTLSHWHYPGNTWK